MLGVKVLGDYYIPIGATSAGNTLELRWNYDGTASWYSKSTNIPEYMKFTVVQIPDTARVEWGLGGQYTNQGGPAAGPYGQPLNPVVFSGEMPLDDTIGIGIDTGGVTYTPKIAKTSPLNIENKRYKCLSCSRQDLDARDLAINPRTNLPYGCFHCGSQKLEVLI